MTKVATRTVTVHDGDGTPHHFVAGDPLPDWAVDAITFPGTVADDVDGGVVKRPHLRAKRCMWVAYAEHLGLVVPDGARQAEIVALVEEHESPEPPQGDGDVPVEEPKGDNEEAGDTTEVEDDFGGSDLDL